ncbi:MAG: FtsH protease activity modulator HflK [Candidatus Fonsibacter sp.]|nr:FtsH protease activity modulator HflK [Candidatus Fonsibacter sp.]
MSLIETNNIKNILKKESPWGAPNKNNKQPESNNPGDMKDLAKKFQEGLKNMFGGPLKTPDAKKPITLFIIGAIAVWALSGFYRVDADEQGVVLRFGKYTNMTQPGLNYHLPFPIESVVTPKVSRVNRIDVGFRSSGDGGRAAIADIKEESAMLTGDENIVDINYSVFWVIKDASKYLFNVQDPIGTIKVVAETAMREVIARKKIQVILTQGRAEIENEVQKIMQQILDSYGSGVDITQVQAQKSDPPAQVIDSFRDVQAAKADKERAQNEAEAYANDVIPRARGEAAKITQEAEGYKREVVAQAEGEASRFIAIYNEYAKAKTVTQERMYLETMEKVLSGVNKIIIDKQSGSGVIPYLSLPELKKNTDTQSKKNEVKN